MRAPTLKDFDHHVTCYMGGRGKQFPIASGDDYYRVSSGHHLVHKIKVPFLALNATDDPIVAEIPYEDIKRSSHVVQLVTPYGGHLGWFEGGATHNADEGPGTDKPAKKTGPPARWVRKPVLEWLQATGEDLTGEFDNHARTRKCVPGKDGWWYEDDREPGEEVGFKFLVRAKKPMPKPESTVTGAHAQPPAAGPATAVPVPCQ